MRRKGEKITAIIFFCRLKIILEKEKAYVKNNDSHAGNMLMPVMSLSKKTTFTAQTNYYQP